MLTSKEIKQLTSLLKKIDNPHEGLPQPVFDALLKVVPFVACELAIVDNEGKYLLTERNDEWFKGWHFPGRLMRYRESFEECIKNVATKEIGATIISYKFLFVKDCSRGSRGHVVSLIFLCKIAMSPKNGKFFKIMPKNIIEEHKELWKKIKKLN